MKKNLKIYSFIAVIMMFFLQSIPASGVDVQRDMNVYRMAVMLSYEIGGAYSDESVKMVASSVMNRYKALKKRTPNLTVTDVLYQTGQYSSGPASITGPLTKNLNLKQLDDIGRKKLGDAKWNRALQISQQAVNGTLGDHVNGGYSYHKGGLFTNRGSKSEVFAKRDTNPLYKEGGQTVDHVFYTYQGGDSLLGTLAHTEYNMNPDAAAGELSYEGVLQYDSSGKGHKLSSSSFDDPDGRDRTGVCSMLTAADLYLKDGVADNACWYCKIVVVITNAYFKAAYAALPSAVALGKLCAKLGFMIWLAYYILLQVSSLSPVTPFKMLQEILVMGFKVALAYLGVVYATSTLTTYFINPIVGLGVDYGSAMLDSMMAEYGVDNTLAGIQAQIDEVRKTVGGETGGTTGS